MGGKGFPSFPLPTILSNFAAIAPDADSATEGEQGGGVFSPPSSLSDGGLSGVELAELIGCDPGTTSKWVHGKVYPKKWRAALSKWRKIGKLFFRVN